MDPDSLPLKGWETKTIEDNILLDMLRKMIVIRKAEEIISENVAKGIIKCPCHLAIGQEAIGTAIAMLMIQNDKAFGAHRSHAHYLALNEDTFSLFSEVLGREAGCSNGLGGSMHIIDQKNGFYGSVPIVGATIPIATGAGLSAKLRNEKSIAISYFGDGACEEGSLHESLNLASNLSLPVLYVCENNLFSSHLHIDLRQPANNTSRFADAHAIEKIIVNGNDVVEIYTKLLPLIKIMREVPKPIYVEAYTYRWKGHVGHRDDIDVGVKRNDQLEKWKKHDPIKRLTNTLIEQGIINTDYVLKLTKSIESKLISDWDKALSSPYPNADKLLEYVYE